MAQPSKLELIKAQLKLTIYSRTSPWWMNTSSSLQKVDLVPITAVSAVKYQQISSNLNPLSSPIRKKGRKLKTYSLLETISFNACSKPMTWKGKLNSIQKPMFPNHTRRSNNSPNNNGGIKDTKNLKTSQRKSSKTDFMAHPSKFSKKWNPYVNTTLLKKEMVALSPQH